MAVTCMAVTRYLRVLAQQSVEQTRADPGLTAQRQLLWVRADDDVDAAHARGGTPAAEDLVVIVHGKVFEAVGALVHLPG